MKPHLFKPPEKESQNTFVTAGKTIAGTVKDGSGNALANVEVFLHRQGFGEAIFGETNASGTFSLAVADYGNYEIGTFKDGMPPVFKSIELRNESGDKIYYEAIWGGVEGARGGRNQDGGGEV